jgi:hypothetical protein
MWATTGNELYVIDRSTGTSEHAASFTGVDVATNDPNAEIMGIMFDKNDVLYATAFIEGSPLFTIDAITGQATAIATPGIFFPHGGALLNVGAGESGNVLHVKADAAGANDGTTWADAYNDLQLALDVAEPGDEIWVAAGTYIPTKSGSRAATFRLRSGVGVYGGFVGTETDRSQREPGANETVLSGDLNGDDVVVAKPLNLIDEPTRSDNSYHVVTGSGTDETAVLDGFVITGGNANGSKDSDGGGMTNVGTPAGGRIVDAIPANPTVTNCTFYGNAAQRNGGGVYNEAANPTLSNCTFTGNYSHAPGNFSQGGGGVYNIDCSPTLVDCAFIGNMAADDGAGMTNESSSPTLINCVFRSNVCGSGPNIGVGAGMYNNNGSEPILVNCQFVENAADLDGTGGGVFNQGGSHAILTNCTLVGNSAGPYLGSWANGGGGMFNQQGSRPIVTNCIFWGNRDKNGTGRSAQISGSTTYGVNVTTVAYSCVQGGWSGGVGNISLDPLFVDAEGLDGILGTADDDLRLSPESPCLDAGDEFALPADIADLNGDTDVVEPIPFDLDWSPRIRGSSVDIGAYEGDAVGPTAAAVYTSHNMGASLGVLDIATGESTDVGSYELPESTGMTATAFDPYGTLYGMLQGFGARGGMSQLAVIDQRTGKAHPIGFANPINAVGLDFGPDGTAYVAGFEQPAFAMEGDTNLYSIDTATGQVTLIGDTGIDRIMDFAFDSAGTMWAATANELYTIDMATGTSQHVASIGGVDATTGDPAAEIMGIMFDENDVLHATAFIEGSPLFTIDTTSGQATVVSQPGLSFPHGGDILGTAPTAVGTFK